MSYDPYSMMQIRSLTRRERKLRKKMREQKYRLAKLSRDSGPSRKDQHRLNELVHEVRTMRLKRVHFHNNISTVWEF